jgi:peptidylamidoglycolate lyase
MIKKTVCFVILAGGIIASYFLQPIKKGKGLDTTIRYERVKNWPHFPKDFKLGNPTGIGIDTNQNIVVFQRADRRWPLFGSMPDKPIKSKTTIIIDKENGKLLASWAITCLLCRTV